MVQECAGAMLASADRAPLRSRQLPGWGEYSEWTHGDRSWCGRPRPSQLSFPTPCHWFPGRVTLVTLSFNLLQRAWPVEHVSGGRGQTLGYWSPNGNYHFLPGCFRVKPRHGDTSGSGGCFAFIKRGSQGGDINAGLPGKEQKWVDYKGSGLRREGCVWWLIKSEKNLGNHYSVGRRRHMIFSGIFEIWEWLQFELWDIPLWGTVGCFRVLSKPLDILFQEREREGVPV